MKMMTQEVSTAVMIRALEDNLLEAWAAIGTAPGVESFVGQGVRGIMTGVPHPALNGVCRANLAPDEVHDRIDEVLAWFTRQRIPMLWWIGPATQPADLGTYLETHGLTRVEDVPGMAVDLRAIAVHVDAPPDLTIQIVDDTALLAHWNRIVAICFEIPLAFEGATRRIFGSLGLGHDASWRHYIALLRGVPVATSSLFLGTESAGIYCVATLPEVRRQGIGRAMTLAALHDARARGYRIAILQASALGHSVYHRLGFRDYCTYHLFHWAGQEKPAGT